MMENRNEIKTNEEKMTEQHTDQAMSQSEIDDRYNTHDIKMAKEREQRAKKDKQKLYTRTHTQFRIRNAVSE